MLKKNNEKIKEVVVTFHRNFNIKIRLINSMLSNIIGIEFLMKNHSTSPILIFPCGSFEHSI